LLSAAGTGPAERILPWTYSPNKSFQRKTQRKGLGNKAEPPEEITLGGRFLASRADAHELQHDLRRLAAVEGEARGPGGSAREGLRCTAVFFAVKPCLRTRPTFSGGKITGPG